MKMRNQFVDFFTGMRRERLRRGLQSRMGVTAYKGLEVRKS
ncbi:hypothetical protein [Ruminococcus sp.]